MIKVFKSTLTKEIFNEAKDLIEIHREETARFGSMMVSLDWDTYEAHQDSGNYVFFEARDGDKLVGYVSFFLAKDSLYSDELIAIMDLIFLKEEYREKGLAPELLWESEDWLLSNTDVTIFSISMKTRAPFNKLLEGFNYKPMEIVYYKKAGE